MPRCRQCSGDVDERFRFCPHCGAALRRKLVEFFPAAPNVASDAGRALRVSRYLGCSDLDDHTRFSIWNADGVADGAVSLSDVEIARLSRFLATGPSPRARGAVESWRRRGPDDEPA